MRGVWYVGFVRGFCVDAMVRPQRGVFASVFASIGRCAVPDSWISVCAPWMERRLRFVAIYLSWRQRHIYRLLFSSVGKKSLNTCWICCETLWRCFVLVFTLYELAIHYLWWFSVHTRWSSTMVVLFCLTGNYNCHLQWLDMWLTLFKMERGWVLLYVCCIDHKLYALTKKSISCFVRADGSFGGMHHYSPVQPFTNTLLSSHHLIDMVAV
jgi:hypothetical protein